MTTDREHRAPEPEIRARILLSASGHHKDRLHSIQSAEWQIYYIVLLIIAFTLYLIFAQSHVLFLDLASGIRYLGAEESKIREYRCFGVTLFVLLFYKCIWYYYFMKFYPKNYASISEHRGKFEKFEKYAIKDIYDGLPSELIFAEKIEQSFHESSIYKGRLFILTASMILCLIAVGFVSYLNPIQPDILPINLRAG